MTNNDILRRIRYTFNFNDKKMVTLFSFADVSVSQQQVNQMLKKDTEGDFLACTDLQLAGFLNGLIIEKRGKKDGPKPINEAKLTNNIVITKLKIALSLQAEDIIELLKSVNFNISKPELSAFSRKPEHKHYRLCKNQVLRNILTAIDKKFHVARPDKVVKAKSEKATPGNYSKKKKADKGEQIQGARPNASAIYQNPNSLPTSKNDSSKKKRSTLKLK